MTNNFIEHADLSEERNSFLEKIQEISGESIPSCIQCGICSSSCPMVGEMDITPSQIMSLTLFGDRSVLESKSIWICASCFNCKVRCPRELDLSKVAEALRQTVLRQAQDRININEIPGDEMMELPQIALVAAFRRLTN
jgi:heterodisulfide reductase subunit C